MRRAGVNAFRVGGISTLMSCSRRRPARRAAAVSSHHGRRSVRRRGGSTSYLLPVNSPAAVARQLGVDSDADSVLLARDDHHTVPVDGSVRLAIVDPTPKRLALARRVVEQGKRWHGRNDLWFSPAPLLTPHDGLGWRSSAPGSNRSSTRSSTIWPIGSGGPAPRWTASSAGASRVGRSSPSAACSTPSWRSAVSLRIWSPAHSIGEWTGMITTQMIPPDRVDGFVDSINPADRGGARRRVRGTRLWSGRCPGGSRRHRRRRRLA